MEVDCGKEHTQTGREKEGKKGKEGGGNPKSIKSERQSGWEKKGETRAHTSTKCRSKR